MGLRFNPDELELLFGQIKSDLKKKTQNQGGYLELEEKGDDVILKFKKKNPRRKKGHFTRTGRQWT